jgi:predicted phosphodiesterase
MKFKGHRVLIIGDTHDSPHIPQDRFIWIGKYIKDHSPDYIVHIGDCGSFDSLSHFQANDTQQGKLKDAYLVDLESMRKALSILHKYIKDIPHHICLGNHEMRVHKFEERIPEIQGIMKKSLYNSFYDYGWTVSEYGEFKYIGGVAFVHAPLNIMGREYGGKNAEVQIANDSVHDLVFGHTHKARDWKAIKIGSKQWVRIINVGCSLPYGHIEEYAKLNMNGWSWNITEIGIWDNHIQENTFISMDRLEREYGNN